MPFESIWSHVSLLFKVLVWFDFLSFALSAFFEERRVQFLFSVTLFIAFTSAASGWL